jgi:quercetin dioxygenase-like cupin family protein
MTLEAIMILKTRSNSKTAEFPPEVKGVTMWELITDREGAPTFQLREVRIEAGMKSPDHSHDWEHEMYILEGDAICTTGDKETPVKVGDAILIPGGEHHFIRAGKKGVRLVCCIPVTKACQI